MKHQVNLDQRELSQAAADYVSKKLGLTVKCDVSFSVLQKLGMMDEPTGQYDIITVVQIGEKDGTD